MWYPLARKLLFQFEPERSHDLSLKALFWAEKFRLTQLFSQIPQHCPQQVMGLDFPHAVGLAAGLDKNGDYIDALAALGFAFIEIGTVTPRAQPGNPKPRLFRLSEQEAIINRMGFNNKGLDYVIQRLQQTAYRGILGINIGKNRDTAAEDTIQDYLFCLKKLYAYASYIAVNISSPNTPGLRDLQHKDALEQLLLALKQEQKNLTEQQGRYVPLVIKISPDLTELELKTIASQLIQHGIDGIIATNTTVARQGVAANKLSKETGGLSGAPLTYQSTRIVKLLAAELKGKIPIIAVGGIIKPKDALEKIKAGANLVQLYTGFIYRGPQLINTASQAIAQYKSCN